MLPVAGPVLSPGSRGLMMSEKLKVFSPVRTTRTDGPSSLQFFDDRGQFENRSGGEVRVELIKGDKISLLLLFPYGQLFHRERNSVGIEPD